MSDNQKKKSPFSIYWIYAIIGVGIIGFQLIMASVTQVSIEYEEDFIQLAEQGYVKDVKFVNGKRVDFKLTKDGEEFVKKSKKPEFEIMKETLTQGNRFKEKPEFSVDVINSNEFARKITIMNEELKAKDKPTLRMQQETERNYFGDILQFMLPIIILIAIWMFVMRRMTGGGGGGAGSQIFNIGKSKAKIYEKGKTTEVNFGDVAGLEGAKEEVQEIVDFLKNPKKYTALGAKIPKGALLVGPPGTGKTLLAKAVAGEAQVPFFSLSGSDFVEMFVGVGASRVRDLFKQAKEKAPSIIFIDEIDAIGRARGKNANFGSNDERENTLNQLLTEMDGFGTNSGVIILAATNRADVLDSALLRAGRFDRQIYVDMPDLNERKEIFQVHLKPLKLAKEIDVDFLAKQTPGFSGADIANLCNEAALIAARKNKSVVEKQDFLDAVDRIIGGLEKKNKIITPEEKRAIAFHEAGHATCSWMLEHAHPLVKVTIVPRGRSLGAAWYLPEERSITTKEQLLDEMCSALGGRAAEEITFGKISTGALSDLEKITKQAYAMVSVYGLNDKVGNISFYDPQGNNQFVKPYSDDMAKLIDDEVSKMIEEQYVRAKQLLNEHKDKLTLLAEKLLTSEVIFKEDLQEIFGKRKWDKEDDTISKSIEDHEAESQENNVNSEEETQDKTETDNIDETTSETDSSVEESEDKTND